MNKLIPALFLVALSSQVLLSQEVDSVAGQPEVVALAAHGGPGLYAVRDEFISHETYSGFLPVYLLTWTDITSRRLSRISMEYRFASHIKNYNVSASITEVAFGVDYLYPVGEFKLLSHDVQVRLGPSPELYFHFRSQNIAKGGSAITRAYSVVFLLSAGGSVEFTSPLSESLTAFGALGSNVLSLGARIVNPDQSDESMIKLLTLFSGIRVRTELGVQYELASDFAVGLSYRLEVARVSSWSYFISGSDMAVLSAHYRF